MIWIFRQHLRFTVEVHVTPEPLGKVQVSHSLIGVCIQLGKGFQSETKSVQRAGEAHVAQNRRN